MKMPEILKFEGHEGVGNGTGPNVTIFGANHGNEICGPLAIAKVVKLIEAGKIKLTRGLLTLVPVCNPLAYDQNRRFVDVNLNRHFYPKDNPQNYEEHIHNVLCPVLEMTDYFMDIHSYRSTGGAFVVLASLEHVPNEIGLARQLGIPDIVTGWADALKKNEDIEDPRRSWGASDYVRNTGGCGTLIECGNHNDPKAPDVAFNAILHFLRGTGIAQFSDDLFINGQYINKPKEIELKGAFLKLKPGEFVQDWTIIHPVEKGMTIAHYDDGEKIVMPEDGYIVLPKADVEIGGEWTWWGVETDL